MTWPDVIGNKYEVKCPVNHKWLYQQLNTTSQVKLHVMASLSSFFLLGLLKNKKEAMLTGMAEIRKATSDHLMTTWHVTEARGTKNKKNNIKSGEWFYYCTVLY